MSKEKCGDDCGDDCPLQNATETSRIIESVDDLNDPMKVKNLEQKGIKPCKGCVGKVLQNVQKGVDTVLSEIE